MALLVFAGFLGVAGYAVASRTRTVVDYERLSTLVKENKALRSKYDHLEHQIDTLNSLLGTLGQHDIQLRVHANMEVLPEDARRLGVGGNKITDPDLERLKEIKSLQYKNVAEISEDVSELLRRAAYQKESFTQIADSLEQDAFLRDHTPSIRPCNGWQCSGFGYRIDPFTRRARMHNGIDIANAPGTPIVATADGTVCYTGRRSGYGLCIEIDHGYEVETFYAHLAGILVKVGQRVSRGEMIATMGATGRTTGTHLHYEVREVGVPVNPITRIIDSEFVTD